jgi:hypothetical protein
VAFALPNNPMGRVEAARDAHEKDVATGGDRNGFEIEIWYSGLKARTSNLLEPQDLIVRAKIESRHSRWHAFRGRYADKQIAAEGVREGRNVGEPFSVIGVRSTIRVALVFNISGLRSLSVDETLK